GGPEGQGERPASLRNALQQTCRDRRPVNSVSLVERPIQLTMQTRNAGFRGSLAETPLPQVLRRIFLEQLKGTLSLVRGDETRHLFFEKGELRTATSSREGQRIGAFLKRRGWITDEELSWALDTVAKQGRARLGKILLEEGLVS